MKKGFVTFLNRNDKYSALNNVLIDSVLEFTNLDIEVLSINFDFVYEDKRVISKRINLEKECIDTIYYSKIYASLTSNFDIGLQLDSDMIVTPDVVKLFDEINVDYRYVKGSCHPWDGPLKDPHLRTMRDLGVNKKTQPYIHATYLFTKNSKDFLKEVYEAGMNLYNNNIHPINYDETVMNCLLWKNDVHDGYVQCYDPYFEYFKNNIGMKTKEDVSLPYSNIPEFKLRYFICHGCKNIEESRSIFENIKNKYSGDYRD